jgi:hypothetical protein
MEISNSSFYYYFLETSPIPCMASHPSTIRARPVMVYFAEVIILAVIYHLAARLGLQIAYV